MLDAGETIDRLASGNAVEVLAVCLVVVSLVTIILYRRLSQIQDQRIEELREMWREASKLVNESNLALGTLTEPLREAVRELRSRK